MTATVTDGFKSRDHISIPRLFETVKLRQVPTTGSHTRVISMPILFLMRHRCLFYTKKHGEKFHTKLSKNSKISSFYQKQKYYQ